MTSSLVYVSKLIVNAITAITPRYRNHTSQEPMSGSMQLTYIPVTAFFTHRFNFRSNFTGMRLPWECDDQSQETNLTPLRH